MEKSATMSKTIIFSLQIKKNHRNQLRKANKPTRKKNQTKLVRSIINHNDSTTKP